MKTYHAEWINEYQFAYLCYDCDDYHYHGNCKDYITNRMEPRGSHCTKYEGDVEIHITNLTKRVLGEEAMKLYAKSLQNLMK